MLKTYAANYISMQESLTNKDKIYFLERLKESNEDEIKSLLITGNFEAQTEAVKAFDNSPIGMLLKEDLFKSITDVGNSVLDVGKTAIDTGKTGADVVTTAYKQSGGDLDQTLNLINKAVNPSAIDKAISFLVNNPGISAVSGAAIAALLATAGYKVYKQFLSQAAKSCSQFGGDAKKQCMEKFGKKAKLAQVATLQKGLKACRKAKDPSKCSQKLTKKIYSLKQQAR